MPVKLEITVLAVAVSLVLVGWAPLAVAQSASPAAPIQLIEHVYDDPSDPVLRDISTRLSSRKVLERLAAHLSPLRLPQKLVLRATECGNDETTRAYASGKDLIFCYEYLKRVERLASGAADPAPNGQRDIAQLVTTGATVHALLHLVSLAIFDQLQIPIWGNAQDAADRLASYIMVRIEPDRAKDWFVGAGMYFVLSSAERPADFTSLSTPDSQRLFDHFCFARYFGEASFNNLVGIAAGRLFDPADTEKIKRLFHAFSLPDRESQLKAVEGLDPSDKIFQSVFYRRMRLCPQELGEIESAFDQTIRPHLVGRGAGK
jgi:hypothetical protein